MRLLFNHLVFARDRLVLPAHLALQQPYSALQRRHSALQRFRFGPPAPRLRLHGLHFCLLAVDANERLLVLLLQLGVAQLQLLERVVGRELQIAKSQFVFLLEVEQPHLHARLLLPIGALAAFRPQRLLSHFERVLLSDLPHLAVVLGLYLQDQLLVFHLLLEEGLLQVQILLLLYLELPIVHALQLTYVANLPLLQVPEHLLALLLLPLLCTPQLRQLAAHKCDLLLERLPMPFDRRLVLLLLLLQLGLAGSCQYLVAAFNKPHLLEHPEHFVSLDHHDLLPTDLFARRSRSVAPQHNDVLKRGVGE